MLKALEVFGFKSFADRTRFEFPPGITVVVGPNGSGKSNIVDAIKWVLGEQSARSLRGKEMADVIFKGSGNGQRKPAATAEATIIFDNQASLFPVDAPEVHVTRRVYRSGEGEYLLNGQPCRLKDIKQLFRGTGVGTDAYSLIEQGKVDTLLQASPKDRRAIFEEAAGISRFNAKKLEAERRLDRVEQNLVRLADIVEEVDGRLRKLKSQASKARRYKEYSDRLKELRTQVALVDWRQSSAALDKLGSERGELEIEITENLLQLENHRAAVTQTEEEIAQHEPAGTELRNRLAGIRERLATFQSILDQNGPRLAELTEELERLRAAQKGILAKLENAPPRIEALQHEVDSFAQVLLEKKSQVARLEQDQALILATRSEIRKQLGSLRAELAKLAQESAKWTNEKIAQSAAYQAALAESERGEIRLKECQAAAADAERDLSDATDSLAAILADCAEVQSEIEGHQEIQQRQQLLKVDAEQKWTQLTKKQIALSERSSFLREIERRQDGLGLGVQSLLAKARQVAAPPFNSIQGIVADILHVNSREFADLVAAALGDRAEHLVVSDMSMSLYLEENVLDLPGRVGIVFQHTLPPPEWMRPVELDEVAGVLGRADAFVECAEENRNLVEWLLSDTWFVEDLALGIKLSRRMTAPVRFVTRSGEVVERDGRLLIGPPRELGGVISRRAELRELDTQLEEVQGELIAAEQVSQAIDRDVNQSLERGQQLLKRQNAVNMDRGAAQSREAAAREKRDELNRRRSSLNQEVLRAAEQREVTQAAMIVAEEQAAKATDLTREQEEQLRSLQARDQDCETRGAELARELTNAKVDLAAFVQQEEGVRSRLERMLQDYTQATQERDELDVQIQRMADRRERMEKDLRNAAGEIERNRQEQQVLDAQIADAQGRRNELQRLLQMHRNELQSTAQRERELQQKKHEMELVAEKLKLDRQNLAVRIQEDYGIQLAQLEASPTAEEQSVRDQVDQEILDLRQKLSNLGAVNMDALSELEELDHRYQGLHGQYQDLVEARDSLLKVIQRINTDSRRLFSETLDHVRANFQVLFRKVFGGGRADIVLEEGVDILEAGIDVVATPPGKHSLGLSLLSGGERALTAVTLLMAIFQYRPSPFCVLDEVDGPLDEANIGRFVDVLREFLQWTKFVVVTHSKRTMTAAHTLYGVTMQESGVSKRVSVRFEDVNEQGEIAPEAVARADRETDERNCA